MKRIPWRDACKFLAGAFFVSAGVLLYLYLVDLPVPVGRLIVSPKVHGARSVVHYVLFATTFYFGFIRKPRK
jgi:hypothetical protein